MSNKGYSFEVQVVDFFRELFKDTLENSKNRVFRVIGSGRNKLATKTGVDTLLEGDVSVEVDCLPKHLLIECKHRKSGAENTKSFAVKKDWVDQARTEAEKIGRWSLVAIKFKHVASRSNELKQHPWYGKDGNSIHYIIPEAHLAEILLSIGTSNDQCIINQEVPLSKVSNVELLDEVKKRLSRRLEKCLDVRSDGGKQN